MKFYVTAIILALTVGTMTAALPNTVTMYGCARATPH
jgi:hypothetical protein